MSHWAGRARPEAPRADLHNSTIEGTQGGRAESCTIIAGNASRLAPRASNVALRRS